MLGNDISPTGVYAAILLQKIGLSDVIIESLKKMKCEKEGFLGLFRYISRSRDVGSQ